MPQKILDALDKARQAAEREYLLSKQAVEDCEKAQSDEEVEMAEKVRALHDAELRLKAAKKAFREAYATSSAVFKPSPVLVEEVSTPLPNEPEQK